MFPETSVRSTLSDVAEVEPIYTVRPYLVLVCWLLIQTDLVTITYLNFYMKIHVFKSQFTCIPSRDWHSTRLRPTRNSVPQL